MNPTEAEVERVARLIHHEMTEYTRQQYPNTLVRELPFQDLHPFIRDRYLHVARALLVDFVTTTEPTPEAHELHRLADDGCRHVEPFHAPVLGGEGG